MENKQILGTYTLLEAIGSGSGGTVYKAYHNRLEQIVVLKKLKHPSAGTLDKRKEVDILKKLKHSFLPQVLDFIEMDGDVYTVMSFIPGKSFQQLLSEGRLFSRQELLRWGMQICSALNYLHSQQVPVIHGDIKPSNIMLTPEGNICLIDFNISFYLDENTVLGYTDGYTSPEQYLAVTGKRRRGSTSRYVINEQSDIYSVGMTLYHLAVGKKHRGYQQDIDTEVLAAGLGEPFAAVIQKAVDMEPGQRYESALKMFRALKNIPKNDKRYKALVRRHRLFTVGLCLCLVAFLSLGAYGFTAVQDGRHEEYNDIVDKQIRSIESRNFQQADSYFEQAKDKLPSELEAYYQKADALYLQGRYADCLDFIKEDIRENSKIEENRERLVDVYALEGLSYMETGDTSAAVKSYEEAIGLGAFENNYYRDYAVALAYDGQEKKAKDILKDAERYGLDDGSIHYTKGEIHYALKEREQALQEFRESIEHTKDSYMQMRAYLMCSKIYEEQGDKQSSRSILLQAKKDLPHQDQIVVLERLVQADIDLSESTGESRYRAEAIDVLNEIIENQWASYEDYDTLTVLYQKNRDFSQAAATLEIMARQYGTDYNYYKRYAFIEAERQNMMPQGARNYAQFRKYYEQAETLYYQQLKDNHTDAEIALLENINGQLQSGGWL